MATKALIIMNPVSGQKIGKRFLADILQVFCKADWECTIHITSQQLEAKKVVEKIGNQFEKIVCIGGDGTFNEVVSGIINSKLNVSVGYIPAGSTNDFANSLKLSKNMVTAAKDIVNGKIKKYDACNFNGRIYTYVASFGAFTRASYATPQNIKNALGHLAYVLSGIIEIGKIKPISMKLQIDDEIFEDEYIFGAICNSTSLGGILNLKKDVVDMNDGLFEVLFVKFPKNIAELNECIVSLTSQNYNSKMLVFKSCESIDITTKDNVEWSLDGEYEKGTKHIKIKNLKDAINLLVKQSD